MIKYPTMDKEQFRLLTQHLLRYNPTRERDFAIPVAKACEHCAQTVTDQVITCEAHKMGMPGEHFKHKCHTCRMTVYDGSYAKEPKQLRPFSAYTPKNLLPVARLTGPRLSKNGVPIGRPRKERPQKTARPPGRPRKNPIATTNAK